LLKRVSWGAIFAGAVTAVALTALLGLLGLGIGLDNLDLTRGNTINDIPKSTLLWWAVISIVATGIGAFVAARLAGIPRGLTGALHGIAVWAVATLATLWLATSAVGMVLGVAGNLVGATTRVATTTVSTAGGLVLDAGGAAIPSPSQRDVANAKAQIQAEAARDLSAAGIGQSDMQQAKTAVGEAARNIAMQPGSASAEVNRLIDRLFEGPNAALSPEERDRLVTVLAQRAGMSRQQAEQVADRWQAQAQAAATQVRTTGADTANEIGTKAVNVSNQALDAMAKVAWGMFWISLAGLVAAILGAAIGGATLGLGLVADTAVAGGVYPDEDDD
jgi:hypothetical protein